VVLQSLRSARAGVVPKQAASASIRPASKPRHKAEGAETEGLPAVRTQIDFISSIIALRGCHHRKERWKLGLELNFVSLTVGPIIEPNDGSKRPAENHE
jgi:hypothetical protein